MKKKDKFRIGKRHCYCAIKIFSPAGIYLHHRYCRNLKDRLQTSRKRRDVSFQYISKNPRKREDSNSKKIQLWLAPHKTFRRCMSEDITLRASLWPIYYAPTYPQHWPQASIFICLKEDTKHHTNAIFPG